MAQKRSIFEEVSNEASKDVARAQPGLIDRGTDSARGLIRIWLAVLFAMVVLMIAVGGLTRLTDSGLSITEWNVVKGAVPPMSAEAWDIEFDKYKGIPEFQLQNKNMTLAEFKVIYWWEWGHRQLGRVIGLVWAIGFFGLLLTRKIPTGWTGRLALLGVLGGLQGAIGWWIVSSGLTGTMLDVASYRLATHLGLAFVILGFIAWYMAHLSRPERELMQARRVREPRLQAHTTALIVFAFIQILLGALVAGIDAGRNYTDWPLMAGGVFPPDMWQIEPIWRNLFENDGTVQFIHRVWGYLTVIVALRVWFVSRRSAYDATRSFATTMIAVMVLQVVIGIVTVMYSAPLILGLTHQLVAVALWVVILVLRHRAQFPPNQSIKGAV